MQPFTDHLCQGEIT